MYSLRHRFENAFYRAMKGFLRSRSHTAARRFGRRVGGLAYHLFSPARRLVMQNLELALPELGPDERRRGGFRHFGAHFGDLLSASRFTREDARTHFDLEGWEHLEAAERAAGGYILTAGHYGSWEQAIYPLSLRIDKLQAVARPPNNPLVAADLKADRERFGIVLVEKKGAGFKLLNAYRKGARIAMSIDQHVRPSAGIQVPFLGHPAWTSPVLAMLSIRTGAPVVHFTCVPTAGGRYRVRFRPPIEPVGRGAEARAALTRRYMEEIERDVRRQPELWLWMHRRWRTG